MLMQDRCYQHPHENTLMNLFAETKSALQWIFQILRQFMRVVPGVTLTVVASLTVARITRLLAFLLPLKVILFAGSEGVPRYFRAFLSPEHRETGIVVLSAAAIISYALTLFLEARAKRLSDSSGADLLSAAGVMSVVANQRVEMQGIYVRFTLVVSATLFVLAGALVLAALDPVLAAYLFGLAFCFYLLTAWALNGVTPLKRNWLADFVEGRLNSYLGVLSSIAFLSGFLIILHPFLTDTGGNILVAIICVILLRQVMGALTGGIKDVVALAQKRQLVDTLVLPDRQFQKLERRDQPTLRRLFGRQDREQLIADKLGGLRQPGDRLCIEWLDPPVRGMGELSIALHGSDGTARHLRQRIFSPRLQLLVENEDLLFRHIPRASVWATPVVERFMHGGHECIVYDAGTGAAPKPAALSASHGDFIVSLWAVELPAALVRIYSASHKAVHERLTDELVSRMDIAVDTDTEADTLRRLRCALPSILKLINAMPLCLINSAFTAGETVVGPDGAIRVLGGWGKWSLEPIGVGVPKPLANEAKLASLLAEARRRNPGLAGDWLSAGHLLLVQRCSLLEQAVRRGEMKSGMATAMQLLADIEAMEGVSA